MLRYLCFLVNVVNLNLAQGGDRYLYKQWTKWPYAIYTLELNKYLLTGKIPEELYAY